MYKIQRLFCTATLTIVSAALCSNSVDSISHVPHSQQPQESFLKLGEHIIAEFRYCNNLNAFEEIEEVLHNAAIAANATILGIEKHKFSPCGMSGIVLLQESHISIHTWPEYDYVAIDIFTCGEHVHTDKALAVLKEFFEPKEVISAKLNRGFTK
ncbi:adenosylmethionine decarboxylase [Candidatus Babeliales bacterium]|nr:adenosylmethionine decarboxylase [Candidatus Babeliales bacterium]